MNLDKNLATLKYTPDTKSHLQPCSEDCRVCKNRPCINACPAGVYEWLGNIQKVQKA